METLELELLVAQPSNDCAQMNVQINVDDIEQKENLLNGKTFFTMNSFGYILCNFVNNFNIGYFICHILKHIEINWLLFTISSISSIQLIFLKSKGNKMAAKAKKTNKSSSNNFTIRTPDFIKPGDTIGVVAPSFGATTEPYITRFNAALEQFKAKGYKIKIGKCCKKSDGLGISTKPEVAAKELVDFYLDPKISAIISCGGGELMCETVAHIDFEAIKNAKPKWFMGYSDNTNFLFPLNTICQTAGIYSNCFPGFGKPWEETETWSLELLEGKINSVHGFKRFDSPLRKAFFNHDDDPLAKYGQNANKELTIFDVKNGKLAKTKSTYMSGTLIGGCLDVLENLAGTPMDHMKEFNASSKGIIWALEACDLNPMGIRRALWHLDQCGWFDNAAGFIIGRPLASFGQEMMGVNQINAVTDILAKHQVPVILDADIGHIDPVMPLVLGAHADIEADGNDIQISFELN